MYSVVGSSRFTRRGFPIQRSPDQRLLATSPKLIAGCYVFRRLFTAKSSTVCPYVLQPSGCPNKSESMMILQILQLHYALLQVLFLCLARITFESLYVPISDCVRGISASTACAGRHGQKWNPIFYRMLFLSDSSDVIERTKTSLTIGPSS